MTVRTLEGEPQDSVKEDAQNGVNEEPGNDTVPADTQQSYISLPRYSDRIKHSLKEGNIVSDLDAFIEETAYHIMSHGDMKSKGEYQEYGRRLITAYPCLEFPGKTSSSSSWVSTKVLNLW